MSSLPARARLVVIAGFLAGALSASWLFWLMRPADWALPFWKTVRAGGDAQTYGHVVEHAAEVLIADMLIVALACGLVSAGVAYLATKGLRRRAT